MRACWEGARVWELRRGGDGDAQVGCEGQGNGEEGDEVLEVHFVGWR